MTPKKQKPSEKSTPKVKNKADAVREYISKHPKAKNPDVVDALAKLGMITNSGYVSKVRVKSKKKSPKSSSKRKKVSIKTPKYPRHSLEKVLRIPQAIIDQNMGIQVI